MRMDPKAKPTDPVVARWADGYTISLPQYSQTRLRMFCAFAGRAEDARRVNALNLEKSQWVVKDMAPARHGIDPAQDGTPRTNPKEDGPGLEEKFRRSVAEEVVKDVVEDMTKRECTANWLEEQGQLNASNLFKWWSSFATGVTGETNVVKGQARDTEDEPDRQHEEAQTKARRKGAEKAQKRARVNTPANAISPPPLPPRRLERMVHDVTAIAGP